MTLSPAPVPEQEGLTQEWVSIPRSVLESVVRIADEAADEWDKAPSGMRAGKIILALAGRIPGYRKDTDAIHAAMLAASPTPPAGRRAIEVTEEMCDALMTARANGASIRAQIRAAIAAGGAA